MRTHPAPLLTGIVCISVAAFVLRADQVEMRNGDRYVGNVLSVSQDAVVLQSELLGTIRVPRKNVASLSFAATEPSVKLTGDVARVSTETNETMVGPTSALAGTNVDLSVALRDLGANTGFVAQVREQMLGGSPEAAAKYNELVNGLMSGQLDMNDLRRQAKSSADQLRTLRGELGPEAGDLLDGYLEVLEGFLKDTEAEPAIAAPTAPSQAQVP